MIIKKVIRAWTDLSIDEQTALLEDYGH